MLLGTEARDETEAGKLAFLRVTQMTTGLPPSVVKADLVPAFEIRPHIVVCKGCMIGWVQPLTPPLCECMTGYRLWFTSPAWLRHPSTVREIEA